MESTPLLMIGLIFGGALMNGEATSVLENIAPPGRTKEPQWEERDAKAGM